MSEQSPISQSAMKYRFGILRRLKESNKTPVTILLLAAVIGAFVGLIGSLFELGTTWVSNYRSSTVGELVTDKWLIIPAMFAVSAILAMVGYYLVKKYLRSLEAQVSQKSKGLCKIYAQSVGGE